jgi:methylmalonyl-CoA/ethylmalonyl-CoA epimerase
MHLSKIGQIGLPVTNIDRAVAFYEGALGLKKVHHFDALVLFDCDGVRLMLEGNHKSVQPAVGVCHYFMVKDIATVEQYLKSKAVAFDREAHLVGKMADCDLWMAFFRDPDGHLLALMEEIR